MKLVAGLIITFGLVGCAGSAAATLAPTSAPLPSLTGLVQQRFVAGGQGGGGIQWLVTVPCSHRPASWADARTACNFDQLAAVSVTPEVYAAKQQGDAYP